MKLGIFTSVLFWLLVICTQTAKADIFGGEITYRCKGNGKYDVYVTAYRDCNSVSISQSNLVARCSSATITVSQQTKISTRDITGVGPNCSTQSACSGTFAYGMEEVIWSMELDLGNVSCCQWVLSWEQCCRSGSITTGYASSNLFITAELNMCLNACNSSPVFTSPAKMLVCYNQDQLINLGAVDTVDNGDSLSYHLVPVLDGLNSPVNPGTNYPYNRPLTFFGFPNHNLSWPAGFHLDPLTGDLAFRPTSLNQIGVIAVEVREWNTINGTPTVIGVVRREFIVHVIDCQSSQVKLMPPYVIQACAGERTCIPIISDDADSSDSTTISWNAGIPGATFTHNNGTTRYASGEICWTPEKSDVRHSPYIATVTARDNNCPLNTTGSRAYAFFVRDMPEAELSHSVLSCGELAFDHTITLSTPGLQFRYDIIDTATGKLHWQGYEKTDTATLPPGIYFLRLRLKSSVPCIKYYEDTVVIGDYVQVTLPPDTVLCAGDSLSIQAAISNAEAPYSQHWRNLNDSSGTLYPQDLWQGQFFQNTTLAFEVSDNAGCSHRDSIHITVNPLPSLDLGSDQVLCTGDSALLDAGGDPLNLDYLWSDGDTAQTRYSGPVQSLWVQVTDSLGCSNRDSILIEENLITLTGLSEQKVCVGDSVILNVSGADSFVWFDASNYQGTGQDIPLFSGASQGLVLNGDLVLLLESARALNGLTCTSLDTLKLYAWSLPATDIGADQRICFGDSVLLDASIASGTGYLWNTGATSPQIWARDSGVYTVWVTDTNGCGNTDSMQLSVVVVKLDAGSDQWYCPFDTAHLFASGADSIRWYDADGFIPGGNNIPLAIGESFSYPAIQSFEWLAEGSITDNGLQCFGYDAVEVTVFAHTPLSSIQGLSQGLDSVQTFTYSVNPQGQATISWSIQNGTILSGQGTSTVQVQWTHPGTGTLTAIGVSPDGCLSEISLQVSILPTAIRIPNLPGFKAYPNPVQNILVVELENANSVYGYVLLNALGQMVLSGELEGRTNSLHLETLPAGVYLLRIEHLGALRIVVE